MKDQAQDVLQQVLDSAREADYTGYSKFDALNSPLLQTLTGNSKWLRLLTIQLVNRSPLHLRPLLGVRKSRNPKGIALFARGYLFLYEITGAPEYLAEAEKLLTWLLDNRSPGYDHMCWGYNFLWQSTLFLQDRYEPNAVVTVFAAEALIHAYRITGKEDYLTAARSAVEFIMKDLPVLYDTGNERAVAYVLRPVKSVVLNNQILTGALLVKVWKHTGEPGLLRTAVQQFNYTVTRRTPYYAWYYTHPREKSPITHDNYHTGGILDGLLEFWHETGDDRYMEVYWQGLDYYRACLFEPDGAPRWMNDRQWPYDIHGTAQGIISFAKAGLVRAGYRDMADIVCRWGLKNLYRQEKGDFIYRQGRFIRWNYSLMRWCNAWMARALGEYCLTGTQKIH